jgi:phosphate transport system substrate-binding protein
MHRLSSVAAAVGLAVLAVLPGCGRQRTAITAAGSTAFLPFAERLADQFMAAHPDVSVTVQGGGSALGIQSALSGAAQIGMADMVQLPPEAAALRSVVVAQDGIALVVNPANGVTNLTAEQARGIFNGAVRNWSEVGGEDRAITVVSREAGSGTRSSFEQILGGVALTPQAIIQDSNGTVRETVAQDPSAIGYLSHGLVNERVRQVALDGALATAEAIAAGQYKLVRPVFLLTKGEPGPGAREFIEYVLSPEGQKSIRDNGLIPAR